MLNKYRHFIILITMLVIQRIHAKHSRVNTLLSKHFQLHCTIINLVCIDE